MINLNKLYDMTSNQVFKAIREGKMAQEDFVAWLEWIEEDSRNIGFDRGYEAAKDEYGDGPSS
jgi:hypothetical protein